MNDKESTRKYASSGSFVDLCDRCFSHVEEDIPSIEGQGDEHDDSVDDPTSAWDDGDEPDHL